MMAAEVEAQKRKEPEPSTDAAKPAEVKEAAKTEEGKPEETPAAESPSKKLKQTPPESAAAEAKPEEAKAAEPPSKKLKSTPPDSAAVRKQVEYYLSDENLKGDAFFHEKISANGEGWLSLQLILSCNKMKAMKATIDDVVKALEGSKLELKDGNAVRRPGNAPLPKLEARPQHAKKSSIHAHDGGVVAVAKSVPEDVPWVQVKAKLKEKLPEKVNIWFCSEVNDKRECVVSVAPFEGDVKFFEELQLDFDGKIVKAEVAQGDVLRAALKLLPKHTQARREKCAKQRQKDRNRPIVVGSTRFINVAALRGRVREILNSRSDGDQLKQDGTDYKLITALLAYHPKGAEKSAGLKGIKVAKSEKGDGSNRCFYIIKESGEEDFSAKKCLDAIEANPPYLDAEKEKPVVAAASAASAPAAPAAAPAAAAPAADSASAPAAAAPAAEAPAVEASKPSEPAKTEEEAKPAEKS